MSYLFGDTDRAALRLRVLADVFATTSRPFLQDMVKMPPQLALDLGCGPGYTTHLLAEATRCERAVGLDNSEHFVSLAGRSASERISFVRHDVTQVPFPTGPGDLIYCRMLLTHLQDPQAAIERWATQLRPGGLLLIEEVEWIRTSQQFFRAYLDIVAAMLEQQGNQLSIGALLDAMQPGGGLSRRMSWVRRLRVSTSQAATMFLLNMQTWKQQPFIQQHYSSSMIERLEAALQKLAETATSEGLIRWGVRQIAYKRLADEGAPGSV
jgi:trans-aconitate 2-methyltransferase